jgi:uncharacterized protein (DUF305 family)
MVRFFGKIPGFLLLCSALAFTFHPAAAHAADFDQQFLGKVIPHHQMGIDMAKDCLQKATHAELKDLCQQIVSKQQEERDKMRSWLQAWYQGKPGAKPSEEMMKQSQQMMDMMKKMSGAEYEKHFMNHMSQHHQQGLKDIEPCVTRASHADLKNLCTTMAADQRKEIEQMHGWLCSWHKDCHGETGKGHS